MTLRIRLLLSLFLVLAAGCDGSAPPSAAPTPPVQSPLAPPPIETIAEFTGGRVDTGGGGPWPLGQSVRIRQGPFNSLRFSWQRLEGLVNRFPVPTAKGTLYVLDREYPGRIADLSPSIEGVVGVSAPAANDEYVFSDAVTVRPDTTYWFYTTDHSVSALSSMGNQDLYPDGEMYVSDTVRFVVFWVNTRTDRIDANFVLRGRRVTR